MRLWGTMARQLARQSTPLLFYALSTPGLAQSDSARSEIIKYYNHQLLKEYVDPYLARIMVDSLNTRLERGYFDPFVYRDEFAYALTETMREVSGDKHIRARATHPSEWSTAIEHKEKKYRRIRSWGPVVWIKRQRNKARYRRITRRTGKDMFTYGDVAMLPGKVAYIEVLDFDNTSWSKQHNDSTRIPWKEFVKNLRGAESVILDLRLNSGGRADLAALFVSSFRIGPNQYLSTSERWFGHRVSRGRKSRCVSREWKTVSTKRFKALKDSSLLVLNGPGTFSAGEWVSYGLQRNAGACVIGAQTAGAGHAYSGGYWAGGMELVFPQTYNFDKENKGFTIERSGVTPDILVPEDSALAVAYRKTGAALTLEEALSEAHYVHRRKPRLGQPAVLNQEECDKLVGDYQFVKVSCQRGTLHISFDDRPSQEVFLSEDGAFTLDLLRVSFVRESGGEACEVHLEYPDGYIEKYRLREAVTGGSDQ